MPRSACSRFLPLLLLGACLPGFPFSCGSHVPTGQFGNYAGPFTLAKLPDGDTLTVYRVKLWRFGDGAPPALQLEYQTPGRLGDSVAVRAELTRVWPVFVPYVEQLGLRSAIVTASDWQRRGNGMASTSSIRSFGFVAARASDGTWMLVGGGALPAAATLSDEVGIFQRNGQPIDLAPLRSTGGG